MEIDETKLLLDDMREYYYAIVEHLPQIGVGLVLLIIFYLLSGPLSRILVRPLTYANSSALIKMVTRRIISMVIILFGVYLFLRLVGLSTFAVAILSGTGVAGLIIGFAFKDIAENFMSSLLLSIQKPFKLNEVIEVNGWVGVVKQVTARATTLIDFDGNHIQIPNSVVYKNTIHNYTANPQTRGHFIVGIGYDADPNTAQVLGLEVLQSMPSILKDPEPQILIDSLGASTYDLKVYFWTNTHDFSLVKVASLSMKKIIKAYEDAGISMPDSAREIVFPKGVPFFNSNSVSEPIDGSKDDIQTKKTKNEPTTAKSPSAHVRKGGAAQVTSTTEEAEERDDLSSDHDDIRKQADNARNPEQGGNIL